MRLPHANGRIGPWSDRQVVTLVRDSVYRGLETYRDTRARKTFESGCSKRVRTDSEKRREREMEHHRIIPDPLWFDGNRAIDEARWGPTPPRSPEHPLFGRPRDSQGPLSKLLVCGVGDEKACREGRLSSAYRCKFARKSRGDCWNRATAEQSVVPARIGRIVAGAILELTGRADAAVEAVRLR